jgi:hypothetical protein
MNDSRPWKLKHFHSNRDGECLTQECWFITMEDAENQKQQTKLDTLSAGLIVLVLETLKEFILLTTQGSVSFALQYKSGLLLQERKLGTKVSIDDSKIKEHHKICIQNLWKREKCKERNHKNILTLCNMIMSYMNNLNLKYLFYVYFRYEG